MYTYSYIRRGRAYNRNHILLKGDVFVKKICGLLVYLFLLVFISGCAKKSDTLILQDFWNKKETAEAGIGGAVFYLNFFEYIEDIFVNRHGDVFNSEGDTTGIMATLKAFEWLVPRSSGECIADNLSAEKNEFITESNKVLNGSEEVEDRVWIRIVPNGLVY